MGEQRRRSGDFDRREYVLVTDPRHVRAVLLALGLDETGPFDWLWLKPGPGSDLVDPEAMAATAEEVWGGFGPRGDDALAERVL